MKSLTMRSVPVAVLLSLVALVLTLMPGVSRADDNATKIAEARQKISQLKGDITGIKIALALTDAGITSTKSAIAAEEKKACPDLGKLIALNIALAGLESTKTEGMKDLAAKQSSLKQWEDYLAALGG
jgi:hypothetical protein